MNNQEPILPYISVIIPVYNQGENLLSGIDSLRCQSIGMENIQLILINDGSTDDSLTVCRQLTAQYPNILLIDQNNLGVSAARNAGIKKAEGKYIFFLDADDCLEKDTLRNVTAFFDSIDEDVDLVTYPIETHYNGTVLPPHFRYKILKKSGVYSLRQYAYIGQTTMNIAIRNLFENNVLFDESQTFSEDQAYCCSVLKGSLKMGYCSDGKYIYHRSHNSSSGMLSGSCYIFEQCMRFFETLFSDYEEVPLTFQGLYVNDIYWKLCSNILLPWHYEKDEYRRAFSRITALLSRCRDDVIFAHPHMDFFEKFYLLRIKENNRIQYLLDNNCFELFDGRILVLRQESVEIVVTRIQVKEDTFILEGFLKTVFFHFYENEITFFAVENKIKKKELQLGYSTHNYYMTHEQTQRFRSFQYSCDLKQVDNVDFFVQMGSYTYPVHYYFMPLVSLSHLQGIFSCQKGKYLISVENNRTFFFSECDREIREEIWLYYDCVGVERDNGRIQFEHDIEINDGIRRFYVLSDKSQINPTIPEDYYVEFGCEKHKELLKKCSKILSAYIEEGNLFPYNKQELDSASNQFDFEVIYLQHGVMHIVMPWKYSRERMAADKVVVSTFEEEDLLKKNGYDQSQLIKCGMPRLDLLKKENGKRVILYAPSWRSYLVGTYQDHKWMAMKEKFLSSQFYKETTLFLYSDGLRKVLEDNDYILEVKLHPIFSIYQEYYQFSSDRIRFADGSIEDGQYDLVITDYSSYAYNFHYLQIPVLYFVPDESEFKCGMNGYRQLNEPDSFWLQAARNSQEILKLLADWFKTGLLLENKVHFYKCNDRCEAIYRTVKGEMKDWL